MSKSYDNTIPLVVESKKLRNIVMKIVTNSQEMCEPKDPDKCNVFDIFRNRYHSHTPIILSNMIDVFLEFEVLSLNFKF